MKSDWGQLQAEILGVIYRNCVQLQQPVFHYFKLACQRWCAAADMSTQRVWYVIRGGQLRFVLHTQGPTHRLYT